MAKVEHDFPLTPRRARGADPRQPAGAEPGGGRPALRPPHRRPDPRRPLPRRSLLLRAARRSGRGSRRSSAASRAGSRREDRARRGGRPRALEGQDVLPRRARAAELHRGLPRRSQALIDDPDALPTGDRAARGLAEARPAHHRRLAALPGQALLRPEPARRAARVGDHRLCLQRRDARLPGAPRRAGRPQRPAHPRRDPDDPAGLLPGPRLRQQDLPAELHALQRRGGGGRAATASPRGDEVAEDCWTGEQERQAAN